MKKIIFLLGIGLCFNANTNAQILTKEDSLAAGLQMSGKTTVLSGYGESMFSYDKGQKTANINVTRFVTFFGHRFSKNITLFSELELEDASVANGAIGEYSLEQMFLKFDLNRSNYIVAGLFIPRIGIINENHLPTTYNGNNRHFVETRLIPSTWRELGLGLYGKFDRLPGFNYYVGLTNGLNSAGFKRNSGLRDGRYKGSDASATNVAVSAAALYYYRNFRIQASAYYGGSAGLSPADGDSLKLKTGAFGTPVALTEMNVQYSGKRWGFKSLIGTVAVTDAYAINRAYANNVAKNMLGAFTEVSYNIIHSSDMMAKRLTAFARYEWFDLNYRMPGNGIKDNALNQQFFVYGFTYKPTVGVAIKLDAVNKITGTPNSLFNTGPITQLPVYFKNNWFFNLGLAYNF